MTDQMQALRNDLAYMREVSGGEEAAAQRKAGVILSAAGVIFAGASLAAWAASQGRLPVSTANWAWLAAMVAFLAVLAAALARGPQAQGARDRATGIAWAAIGSVIFTAVVGFQVIAAVLRSPVVFAGLPTVILALYGAGWTVAAHMGRRRWMAAVALGGHVAAVVLAFMVASPALYLAYAAALLALATAPGCVLLARRG